MANTEVIFLKMLCNGCIDHTYFCNLDRINDKTNSRASIEANLVKALLV